MNQVLIHQQIIAIPDAPEPVTFSLSKYSDCLVILLNQGGAPGSILEGRLTESAGQMVYEEHQQIGAQEAAPLYEMRVLFGSSEIQFYELLLRRQLKAKDSLRVLLNISLPVFSASFKQEVYYPLLVESIKGSLPSVFDA